MKPLTFAVLLNCMLSCIVSSSVCAQVGALFVDPACPKPDDPITLRLLTNEYRFVASAEVNGNTIRMVVSYPEGYFGEPVEYGAKATVGPLPVGSYRVDAYQRTATSPGVFGTEYLVRSGTFEVSERPPVCEARYIIAETTAMVTGLVGQPYALPLAVRVVDAHGQPVPNATVYWQRVEAEQDYLAAEPRPDVAGLPPQGPGNQVFQATPSAVAGVFQFRAYINYAKLQPTVHFAVRNRAGPDAAPVHPVVEYHNGTLDHYFLTSDPREMAALDSGAFRGWRRTGGMFLSYGTGATAPEGVQGVCRFYGLPKAGLNSHFFSASPDECAEVQQRFGDAWLIETRDAFGALLPDATTGACPSGTRPLYRAFNSRVDANHRYSIVAAVLANTPALYGTRWVREGYGPDAVAMCVPQ